MDIVMNIVWIVSAVISAVATTYTIYYFVRDFIFQKQVSLPKDYITEYDMMNNGRRIVRKTRAKIKQSGRKIKGYEVLERLDQRWKLEGKILDKNKITGHFESKSMRHTSYGNMFLEIGDEYVLRGNWLGYEGVNNIINKGFYNLYPILTDLEITLMDVHQVRYVLEIAEQTYGKGTLKKEEIEQFIKDDNKLALIATHKEKHHKRESYGFLLADIKTFNNIKKIDSIKVDRLPDALQAADTIGMIEYLAVTKIKQNRGIGTDLLEAFVQQMKRLKATALLAVVPKQNNRVPLETGFSMRSFSMVNSIPTDENPEPPTCRYCDQDKCTCEEAIFYKIVA